MFLLARNKLFTAPRFRRRVSCRIRCFSVSSERRRRQHYRPLLKSRWLRGSATIANKPFNDNPTDKKNLGPNAKTDEPMHRVVRRVFRLAWPEERPDLKLRLCGSVAALFVGKVLTIAAPLQLGRLVDSLGVAKLGGEQTMVPVLGLINIGSLEILPFLFLTSYGLARLSASFFTELRTFLFAEVVQAGCKEQAGRIFRHLHKLDIDYLLTLRGGEVQAIINRALQSITMVMNTLLFNVVPTLLEFTFVVAIVYSTCGLASSGIVAGTFGSYLAFTTWYSNKRREEMKRANNAEDRCGGLLIDSIINAEAVRYFGSLESEARRYGKALTELEKAKVEVFHSLAILNFGQQFIINTGLVSLVAFATWNVLYGNLPVGDVVAINTLVMQLAYPLNFLGGAYRITLQGCIDLQKLDNFLNLRPSLKPGTLSYEYKKGTMSFKNVNFRTLKDVSFKVEGGTKVGIVGPSGSGKSTILKLLCRMQDPNSGSIEIDGQPLNEIDLKSLSNHLTIVPQESVLFNDSVLYNLKYGLPDAEKYGDEELLELVQDACRRAQIHEVIMKFPNQYKTNVGERGARLSGGERQRVSIARALLRDPDILLFDEATASLDVATELKLQEAIDIFVQENTHKTMLIVAHRLSTIRMCDQILYLEDGVIKEWGSHTELMAKEDGEYRKLWAKYMHGSEDLEFEKGRVVSCQAEKCVDADCPEHNGS